MLLTAFKKFVLFPELETLYESYPITDERTHRNKVIVGLMVYQALTRDELETLRPDHLKLREGKINIPQTGKLNSRILSLEPHQILDLQEYVLLVRPKIMADRMAERSGTKPDKYKAVEDVHRLFVTMNGQETMKNSLLHLNYALRKINPKYKHRVQIRQSVITEWLKAKNLRTVQYMAGHRYISSTERYQTSNLEDLKMRLTSSTLKPFLIISGSGDILLSNQKREKAVLSRERGINSLVREWPSGFMPRKSLYCTGFGGYLCCNR